MTLDGWSLNNKIDSLRDDLTREMRELKINFAVLYDYLKKMDKEQPTVSKTKKKTTVKN